MTITLHLLLFYFTVDCIQLVRRIAWCHDVVNELEDARDEQRWVANGVVDQVPALHSALARTHRPFPQPENLALAVGVDPRESLDHHDRPVSDLREIKYTGACMVGDRHGGMVGDRSEADRGPGDGTKDSADEIS